MKIGSVKYGLIRECAQCFRTAELIPSMPIALVESRDITAFYKLLPQ